MRRPGTLPEPERPKRPFYRTRWFGWTIAIVLAAAIALYLGPAGARGGGGFVGWGR
ncbi:MAG: hypothetical protein QNI84_04350 [Henriciella sp.]|nr:hypothetical protein [Henriciella sp.]